MARGCGPVIGAMMPASIANHLRTRIVGPMRSAAVPLVPSSPVVGGKPKISTVAPNEPLTGNPNDAAQIPDVLGADFPSPLRRVRPTFRSIATGPIWRLEISSSEKSVVPVPAPSGDAVGSL